MTKPLSKPKTILIVTTYFYPDKYVGAIRVSEWASHLTDLGWHVVVLKRYPSNRVDDSMEPQTHSRITVYPQIQRNKIPTNNHRAKQLKSLAQSQLEFLARALLKQFNPFVPDTSSLHWASRRTKALLRNIYARHKPDIILTSTPHHGIHKLGIWAKENWPNVPWVADFRDPYLIDVRYRPKRLEKLFQLRHQRFEKKIYRQANLVTHAIPIHYRHARTKYPQANVAEITNGFPRQLCESKASNQPNRQTTTILSTGSHDPITVKLLGKIVKHPTFLTKTKIQFRLAGTGTEEYINHDTITGLGLISHKAAIEEIISADILLCSLTEARSKCFALSSKLFEYVATGRPVILVNPTRSDKLFAKNLANVMIVTSPTEESIFAALSWALQHKGLSPNALNAYRTIFNRQRQSEKLAFLLDSLIQISRNT